MIILKKSQLADYIKQVRDKTTQAEFARELGVSRMSVIQWEHGINAPRKHILKRLHLSEAYIVCGEEE